MGHPVVDIFLQIVDICRYLIWIVDEWMCWIYLETVSQVCCQLRHSRLIADSELRRSGGVRCLLPRTVSRGQAARSVTINTGSLDQRYLSNIIITIQIYIMPEVTKVDCFAAPAQSLL